MGRTVLFKLSKKAIYWVLIYTQRHTHTLVAFLSVGILLYISFFSLYCIIDEVIYSIGIHTNIFKFGWVH